MKKNVYLVPTLVALVLGGALSLMVAHGQTQPAYTTTSSQTPLPPLPSIDSPEVQDALARSRDLLALLKAHDGAWNFAVEFQQLPGRKVAEKEALHGDRASSFTRLTAKDDGMEDVAFYSDIYVRHPVPISDKVPSKGKATGFYIVGFRDGRVEAVPVDKVRTVYAPSRPGDAPDSQRLAILFPDSPHYDDPKLENVGHIP